MEAFALPNTLATTLARVLVDEVICRYGVPFFINSINNWCMVSFSIIPLVVMPCSEEV